MSVIIRLQNLPWSANAGDIRLFFRGLSIPEGGVHIVGGEHGDVFIAFSSDEDARQAMALTGEKLQDVPVKLLLSSRTEMQRVIDQTRSGALATSSQQSQAVSGVSEAPVRAPSLGNGGLTHTPTVQNPLLQIPTGVVPFDPTALFTAFQVNPQLAATYTAFLQAAALAQTAALKQEKPAVSSGANFMSTESLAAFGLPQQQQMPPVAVIPTVRQVLSTPPQIVKEHEIEEITEVERKPAVLVPPAPAAPKITDPESLAMKKTEVKDVKEKERERTRTSIRSRSRSLSKERRRSRSRSRSRDRRDRRRGRDRSRSRDRRSRSRSRDRRYRRSPVRDRRKESDEFSGEKLRSSFERTSAERRGPRRVSPPVRPQTQYGTQRAPPIVSPKTAMPVTPQAQPRPNFRPPMQQGNSLNGSGEQLRPRFPVENGTRSSFRPVIPAPSVNPVTPTSVNAVTSAPPTMVPRPMAPVVTQAEERQRSRDPRTGSRFSAGPMDSGSEQRSQQPSEQMRVQELVSQDKSMTIKSSPQPEIIYGGHKIAVEREVRTSLLPFPSEITKTDIQQKNLTPSRSLRFVSRVPNLSYKSIRQTFRGIVIRGDGIRLLRSLDGKSANIAYVRFETTEDKIKAMRLKIDGLNIVTEVSDKAFDQSIDGYEPNIYHRDMVIDSCFAVRNLPNTTTTEQVKSALLGFEILDIALELLTNDFPNNLIAYIRFSSFQEAERASELLGSGLVFSGIVLPVILMPIEQYYRAKLGVDAPKNILPETKPTKVTKSELTFVKNLPKTVTDRDLLDFFSDAGVFPVRIHFLLNKLNEPSGDAVIEFENPADAEKACTKHQSMMGLNIVEVNPVSKRDAAQLVPQIMDMKEDVDMEIEEISQGSPLQKGDDRDFSPMQAEEEISVLRHQNNVTGSGDRDQSKKEQPVPPSRFMGDMEVPALRFIGDMEVIPRFTGGVEGPSRFTGEIPLRPTSFGPRDFGPRPVWQAPRPIQPSSRPILGAFSVHDARPPLSHRTQEPRVNFRPQDLLRGPRPYRPQDPRNASVADRRLPIPKTPAPFSDPQCVVSLSNIPFSAGLEHILEFFSDFDLKKEQIARRFTEDGMPTSDARVSFASPMEARRALKLSGNRIWKRVITLSAL